MEPIIITLVDAPERDPESFARETQRTYKVSDGKVTHTVRIRFDFDRSAYAYVIENLVSGKWHKLLTGDTEDRSIPFDVAAQRAAAVLL